jgi:hypothetical protein
MNAVDGSKVPEIEALLRRAYDLIQYAREKQDSAPIPSFMRDHPAGHVESDARFTSQRDQLKRDIRGLIEARLSPS